MTVINKYTEIARAQTQHNQIAREVFQETDAQLVKWGVQNHPTGANRVFEQEADYARRNCDDAAQQGEVSWLHILKEEFWEAFAEEDPERFEKEMIQVAAVAVSAVASSRRSRGA